MDGNEELARFVVKRVSDTADFLLESCIHPAECLLGLLPLGDVAGDPLDADGLPS